MFESPFDEININTITKTKIPNIIYKKYYYTAYWYRFLLNVSFFLL